MAGTINAASLKIGMDIKELKASGQFASNELRSIGRIMTDLEGPTGKFEKQMQLLERAMKQAGLSEEQMAQAQEHLAAKFGIVTPAMQRAADEAKQLADAEALAKEQAKELADQLAYEAQILKQREAIMQRGAQLTRQVETAEDRMNREIAEYNTLRKAGAIDEQAHFRLIQQTTHQYLTAEKAVKGFKDQVKELEKAKPQSLTDSLKNLAMTYIGLSAAVSGLKMSLKLAAEAESSKIAFEVMTGSASTAEKLLKDFKKLDIQSPINYADFTRAGKTLLQFGVATEMITPTLRQLSAVSLGNSEQFQSLTLAFSQVSAAGRLTGQDLLQFVNAGFNPLQEISRTTGESMLALKKRMEDGGVSAAEVAKAFELATTAGGRFAGMNERLENSLAGQFSKMQGDIRAAATELGTSLIPAVVELSTLFRNLMNSTQSGGREGFLAFYVRKFSEGTGAFFASLQGQADEYLDKLNDVAAEQAFMAKFGGMIAEHEAEVAKKKADDLKKLQEEQAKVTQQEKQKLAEFAKQSELNKTQTSELQKLREEYDLMTLGQEGAIEAQQRAAGYTDADIERYKKFRDTVQALREEKEKAAESEKAFKQSQSDADSLFKKFNPQSGMRSEMEKLFNLRQGGFIDDTLMNQAGVSLAAGFVQNASGGLASTIAPALRAGSVEAYKFIAQQNEKSKQAAEAKKLAEDQLKELRKIAEQNTNAPRLAMAGRN